MRHLMLAIVLTGLAWLPAASHGHSLAFIEGEATVHPDKLMIKLGISPENLLLSTDMPLIVSDKIDKADIDKGATSYRKYLLDGLIITDAEGHRLTGTVSKVEAPAIPADGIEVDALTTASFIYHLEYPLAKPPPKLSFQQNFNTEVNPLPVVLNLTVTRQGQDSGVTIPVPIGDPAEAVSFQWDDAAAPATAAAQATTLDPTDAFLYIQNEEVRTEILMPLPTLELWLPVKRAQPGFLEVAEQAALRPAIEKFFKERNPLRIDGLSVKPKLDRLDFLGPEVKDFTVRAEPKRQPVANLRLGVILSYSTKGAPRRVEWTWNAFNERANAVRGTLFPYDKGERFALAPNKPVVAWDNPGVPPLPKIQAVLSQQGAGDDKTRAALAETLLRNVYRGFDYHNESDVYDALAQSVHGELLTTLYLKIKQGLTAQEQGGAVAQVREVKVIRTEPATLQASGGFARRVTWQVTGSVEHWGHIHTRVNEYTADLAIAPADGAWKITALEVVNQSQVQSSMSVRKL